MYARYKREGRTRLIAEGDSWFDYQIGPFPGSNKPPQRDIPDMLAENFNFAVFRVSKAGDTLGNMVAGHSLNRTLERIQQERPAALIFSGGGNDVVGPEMARFLREPNSKKQFPVNQKGFTDYVRNEMAPLFRKLRREIDSVSPGLPILVHGYAYALPSGRPVVQILWGGLIGPWLLPALTRFRITDPDLQRKVIRFFVDTYNDQLASLARQLKNFLYVNCRDIVNDSDWRDELHLRPPGFRKVARRFAQRLG
jgi:lysophospholipase L1-like esterase